MGWKMKKSYFSIALYIQKNHPSSKLVNGVKKYLSLSVVSLIVKFSHKVH